MNDHETYSGQALLECIRDLEIPADFVAHEVDVGFVGPNGIQILGNTSVIFRNERAGDLPYIEPDHTIRSFGIFVSSFKPRWETFRYDKERKDLSISGEKFPPFTIRFL
ncbi:hypothetical protein ACFSSA_09195 [Luteolibacter algae]|uniref:Uncharacterized protein n=1 Tax=Luteolibacter algae TaxID=454151 RepID=A0ABW5D7Z0_9BACT